MSWGVPNRPKISNRVENRPTNREGADGDIQIKGTGLGAKLFAKWSGRWWDVPLSIDGVTKIGVTDSDYLSIDTDSIDIFKDSVKVASFGETTTIGNFSATSAGVVTVDSIQCSGKIKVGKSDGTFNATDNICIGQSQSGLGTQNIGIGYKAGEGLTAPGSVANILIGYEAGKLVASSSGTGYNTCIGTNAGDTITTGIQNICIGHASDVTTNSVNYQIAIGRLAKGNGAYGIAIGDNISAATNDCVIGRNGNKITVDFDDDGTWDQSSDIRKKTNIQDDNLGLAFINDLKTKIFQWKPAEEHPEEWGHFTIDEDGNKIYADMNTEAIMHGMIAQEVKGSLDKVGCNTFSGWKVDENGQQRLSKASFVIPLIKAVQELSTKLDTMQTEINTLKEG